MLRSFAIALAVLSVALALPRTASGATPLIDAVKAGIAPRWTEQNGAEREVSAESLRFILQALGLPAGTDADLRQSLATVEAGANLSAQSRFTLTWVSRWNFLPKIDSSSSRAAVPTRFSVAPPRPTTMPLWESRLAQITASARTRCGFSSRAWISTASP